MNGVRAKLRIRFIIFAAVVGLLGTIATGEVPGAARSLGEVWSPQAVLSVPGTANQRPQVTVDQSGTLHVIWSAKLNRDSACSADTIVYTPLQNNIWGPVSEVLVSPNDRCVTDLSLAYAPTTNSLHLVWGDTYTIYSSTVNVQQANRADAWSRPSVVAPNNARYPDLAIDHSGRLHIAYIIAQPEWRVEYTYSDDSGAFWSAVQAVAEAPADNRLEAVELAVDERERVHLVWTSEFQTGIFDFPFSRGGFVFYAQSTDRGRTWSSPLLVDGKDDRYQQDYGAGEIAITTIGEDEVHLAWAGPPAGQRWHQHSINGGVSWQAPQLVAPLDVFGGYGLRNFNGGMDLAPDSAGRVHLITSGSDRLTHVVWQAGAWSPLDVMLDYNPFAPRLAIGNGNILHVVGATLRSERDTVRQAGSAADVAASIWYMSAETEAPAIAPSPRATQVMALTHGGDNSVRATATAATRTDIREPGGQQRSIGEAAQGYATTRSRLSPVAVGAIAASLFLLLILVLRQPLGVKDR